MTPADQNSTYDRSLITRLLKSVAWQLGKDEGFAQSGADVFTIEDGDLMDKLANLLAQKLSVMVLFEGYSERDPRNAWVARCSIRFAESVMMNRAKGGTGFTASSLAEMAFAILHGQRLESDQDNWSSVTCKNLKMEGWDEANNLLVYSLEVHISNRPTTIIKEEF